MLFDEEQAELIAAYETEHNIAKVNRYTEYETEIDSYVVKDGIKPEFIYRRLNEAVREKEENEINQDFTGVMQVILEHNMTDSAEYSMKNIDKMLEDFYFSDKRERIIGLKERGKIIYLLSMRKGDEFPILTQADMDKRLNKIRYDWLIRLIHIKEMTLVSETGKLLAESSSAFSRKQPGVNYTKQINKKMQMRKKLFVDERMEGYDFREVNLEDSIFINCYLKDSNFSHVNLTNAVFINCILDGAVWLGAELNNTLSINGEPEKIRDVYRKYALD